MKIDFEGRTVLVTGADHGLGRTIAAAFAELGAVVWASGLNPSELEVTASLLGPRGRARAADVTVSNQVDDLVLAVEDERDTIDVLVNNAGGVRGQRGRAVEMVSDADWADIVAVNLTGSFNCARAVAPLMKRAGRGVIINISSGAGLGVSLTGIQAYASAKAGQIGLTRQLAHELGPFGIRVNAVAPGFVLSNPDTERQWRDYGPDGQERLLESIHLRRLGRPDDIADAVVFLASERASWITAQVLQVNGGR